MTFEPIQTDRLVIRTPTGADVDAVWRNRNDPAVAELQAWTLPVPKDEVERMVLGSADAGRPEPDSWWMAIVQLLDGSVIGNLAIHPTWGGRTVEIGYSLDSDRWGHGYAVEAVEALTASLFGGGAHRLTGMLHPDNHASAMVLERTGFRYEGRTRGSYWVGDEVSDDLIYGMTVDDWQAWQDRPTGHPEDVALVPIDPETVDAVGALETHHSQRRFVAPMGASYGDALFPETWEGEQTVPWLRAVQADGELAGFVMVAEPTAKHPPFLWRLLIDRRHQRRGIGARVLDLVVDQCRTWGSSTLETSWGEGKGSPGPFYRRLGFEPTGRVIDGETEGRLEL